MRSLLVEENSVDLPRGRRVALKVFVPSAAEATVTDDVAQPGQLQKVQGGGAILLVEDEPSIREMTTMFLKAAGYRVIGASDSATALMLWEEHRGEIDLVLTDLMLPGSMNGHQLVARLQADRSDLKAILVSGHSFDRFGEEMFADAAISFLEKPYRLKGLSDLVGECIGQREAV